MKKILCTLFLITDLYGLTSNDLLHMENPSEEQTTPKQQIPNDLSHMENPSEEQGTPKQQPNLSEEQAAPEQQPNPSEKQATPKQLTPRYLSRMVNPPEEQITQMRNDFLQTLNEIRDVCKECNDYTGEDESKKQELNQKKCTLLGKIQRYAVDELSAISRRLFEDERSSAQKFAEALGLDPKNTEIVIIDAVSYIFGMYLNLKRKVYFLQWLTEATLAEDRELFKEHLSKINFPNKFVNKDGELLEIEGRTGENNTFRQKVLKMIIDSSKTSCLYRSLMICFFAKMEAIPSICCRCTDKNMEKSIFEGSRSCFCRGGVVLSESQSDRTFHQTLFRSNQTIGPSFSGASAASAVYDFALFHECGHSLDFSSSIFEFLGINKTMEKVAPKFFDMSMDIETFKNQKSNIKKRMEENPQTLPHARAVMRIDFKSLDDYIEYSEKNLNNPIFQSKSMMSNSTEVWQIFGVSLLNLGGKEFLLINLMSDFVLYLDKLLPIRMSHTGFELPIEKDKSMVRIKPMSHHKLPLQVYGALMDFYGVSLSGYLMQLKYPYGLSSLLMNEYRLTVTPIISRMVNDIAKR